MSIQKLIADEPNNFNEENVWKKKIKKYEENSTHNLTYRV